MTTDLAPLAEGAAGREHEARNVELTILMPCLDEAETLGTCIRKAQEFLARHAIAGEVLIADNGSSDASPMIAAALGARVLRVAERGYGNALRAGIAAARGIYVVMGDADDSYDFSKLDDFVAKLRAGDDLVMGNLFMGGIEAHAMPALHRYLGNPVLTAIGRLFFASPVKDFHCGLRGFRRDSIMALDLMTAGMEFASEMVVKATLSDLKITEVATTLSPDGRSRRPHLRSWRDGWRHLRFLMLFCPRWLFYYPGCLLMLVGLGTVTWLLPGPRSVGSLVFDVNTLLFAAAGVICGFQAVIFAVFTKVFAINEGLLPADPRITWLSRVFSLEVGITIGLVLIVLGVVLSGLAVGLWGGRSFGPLDPGVSLRVVIPAATSLILGLQITFSSFFLSVLGLKRP